VDSWCSNCGGARVYAKGRCRHCYRFWRRNGRERTAAMHDELVSRRIERELERRWLRPA
jgi:hypothetical protein